MLAEHERRRQEAEHDAQVERDRSAVRAKINDPNSQWANLKRKLAAGRSDPKPRRRRRFNPSPDPTEAEAEEHRRLHAKVMAEIEAAGLSTEPLPTTTDCAAASR